MRVGVVGAGFAGLMAADRLCRSGHDVVVLEARDRVGGRVWSQELVRGDETTVVERGAEFVLEGYDLMRSTAADLGLGFADMGMSYHRREPRGGLATTHQAIATCAATLAEAGTSAPWATPLPKVMGEIADRVDPGALAALSSRLEVTNAYPIDRLSARAVAELAVPTTPPSSARLVGGNQSLALGLASRLSQALRLRTAVRTIAWAEDEVRLSTSDDELVVDAAILAVPLAVAREMRFEPPLPAWKLQTWERAGFGQAAKLHIPLTTSAPPGAVQSVPEKFWTWTARDGSGAVQPVLHGFSGSGPALAALGVEDGAARWAARAAALRPELSLDLDRAMVTSWADDPWAREAYTALTVDVGPDDDELLRRPVGALHFAGEHTSGSWAGLMEGALRSGERAAVELVPPG